jgi:hypothetical protein
MTAMVDWHDVRVRVPVAVPFEDGALAKNSIELIGRAAALLLSKMRASVLPSSASGQLIVE